MQQRLLFKIVSVIYSAIFLCSCTPHFYQPKPLEPVLLTKEDQLKINFIYDINLPAVSIAYSPRQSLGIQIGLGVNDNKAVSSNNAGSTIIYLDEHYFNPYAAVGYYKSISKKILFEIYTGAGMYNYKNNAVSYLKKMQHVNLFLQPSIAFVHKNIDAAFTLRIDNLNQSKTVIKDSVLSPDDQEKYKFLNYKSYFFIQPGITIRAGFKYVKFQFQISKSIPFSTNYESIYGYGPKYFFDPFEKRSRVVFGFGVTGEIDNIFKKAK